METQTDQSNKLSKWEIATRVFTVIATFAAIAAVIGIFLAWQQFKEMASQTRIQNTNLEDNRKIASANFVLQIEQRLNGNRYDNITAAIEDNKSTWPLLKPRGKFTESNIEDYIGNYDEVGTLYKDGLINESLAYDDFSYDVEKAYCNKDIYNYIQDLRKQDGDLTGPQAFYCDFEHLAKIFLAKDKKTCADLDKE